MRDQLMQGQAKMKSRQKNWRLNYFRRVSAMVLMDNERIVVFISRIVFLWILDIKLLGFALREQRCAESSPSHKNLFTIHSDSSNDLGRIKENT
jgi:hypothetical protein